MQQQQGASTSSAPAHKPVQKEDSFDISYVLQMLDNKDDAATAASAAASAVTTASAALPAPTFVPATTASLQQQQHVGYLQQQQQQQHPVTTSQLLSPPPPPYPSTSSASGFGPMVKQEFVEPMEDDDDDDDDDEGEFGSKALAKNSENTSRDSRENISKDRDKKSGEKFLPLSAPKSEGRSR